MPRVGGLDQRVLCEAQAAERLAHAGEVLQAQPAILRENRSKTTARYSRPSSVGT